MDFIVVGAGLVLLGFAAVQAKFPFVFRSSLSGRAWMEDPEAAADMERRWALISAIMFGGLGVVIIYVGLTA